MALLFSIRVFADSKFAVWHITEPVSHFVTEVPLSALEAQDIKELKGRRYEEWWACRWLLHRLTGAGQRLPLAKTAFSKPFFLEHPDLHCSLSHSQGIVAALLSDRNCGCDIQVQTGKMAHIAPRFLHPAEKQWVEGHPAERHIGLQHLFWTMKEAMYKTYSLKELDFREHIRIAPFDWNGHEGAGTGTICKGAFSKTYRLVFGKYEAPEPDFDGPDTVRLLPLPGLYWTVCCEA